MRLLNMARATDNSMCAKLLEETGLGAERHRLGFIAAGEALQRCLAGIIFCWC